MILDKEPLLQGVMVSGLKTVPHRGVSIHMTIFIYMCTEEPYLRVQHNLQTSRHSVQFILKYLHAQLL